MWIITDWLFLNLSVLLDSCIFVSLTQYHNLAGDPTKNSTQPHNSHHVEDMEGHER